MTDLAVLPLDSGGLVPLAGIVLPSHLSGERGRNRASGLPQVAADDNFGDDRSREQCTDIGKETAWI